MSGEIAQCFRTFTALSEDQGLIPSALIAAQNHLEMQLQKIQFLVTTSGVSHRHIYT